MEAKFHAGDTFMILRGAPRESDSFIGFLRY